MFLIGCGVEESAPTYCVQFPQGPYKCSMERVQKTCTLSNRVTTLSSGGNTKPKCWIAMNCPNYISTLDNNKSPSVSVSNETYTITGYTYESLTKVECVEIKD